MLSPCGAQAGPLLAKIEPKLSPCYIANIRVRNGATLCRYAKCANYFAVSYAWPPTLSENHSGITCCARPLSYLSEVSCLSSLLSSLLSVSSLALSLVSCLFSLLSSHLSLSLSLSPSLPPFLPPSLPPLSLSNLYFFIFTNLYISQSIQSACPHPSISTFQCADIYLFAFL